MKKKLMSLLGIGMILFSLFSPITSANDEFGDFSTDVGDTGGYVTTQEDAQGAAQSFISKMDVFGGMLLSNTILYGYYYSNCFTIKQEGSKSVTYAKPAFCGPKGSKLGEGQKPIRINGDLRIQDLMNGNYKLANSTLLVLIPLLFSIGLIVYIFNQKYEGGTGSSGGDSSGMSMGGGMGGYGGSSMGGGTSGGSTLGNQSGFLSGKIGGWFIEKLFGKSTIKKDSDEDDDGNVATKIFAGMFLVFLLGSGNALSLSLNSSIPIYFDGGFVGIKSLYGIGILYLLSYMVFLSLIFILIKFSLLSFIKMDIEKKENVSVPIETFKLIGIAMVLLLGASFLVGNFGVQLFSVVLQA